MDSNLLKEAIADAKAVRQTALANAKAALEEAFGNRLEAMFAEKLGEDPTGDLPSDPAVPPVAAEPIGQEGDPNQTDIEEIIAELEAGLGEAGEAPGAPGAVPPPADPAAGAVTPAPMPPMGMDPAAGAPGAVPPPAPMPPMGMDPAAGAVPPAPAPAPAPAAPQGDEMDEEIDIAELLESLKAEEEEEEKPDFLKEGVPVGSSDIGGKAPGGTDNKQPSTDASKSSGIESSGKSVKSANVGTPDHTKKTDDATAAARPNQAKNATKDNLSTPGGALKENTGGSTPGYPEGAKKTSSGDDASIAPRPNQAEHATKDNLETVPSPLKENEQLKAQLNEAEQALTYLRQQLNEINLLNAKLLYTNKLFKEYGMDNSKKMKIVEMFDLAKNVREVKMTYAVIAESLNFGADFKRKTASKVQSITEGMASKPVAGTAPKQIITEGAKSEMVSKFQKLAGIKAPSKQSTK